MSSRPNCPPRRLSRRLKNCSDMSVEIKTVSSRADLMEFIRFPEKLYRDNDCYISKLEFDQIDTLDPKRNPSSAFCESELYLAYKNGELAGRVAAIVNNKANAQWNHQEVRFGWFDFVDDTEVSAALIDKVRDFGRTRGMDTIVGPLGFTDFDPEGMLIEGYDKEGTMALIYNHPYYVKHIEDMGFEKEAEWSELRIMVPDQLPERIVRASKILKEKLNVHVKHLTKRQVKKGGYGRKVFALINECYKNLYNFTVLPEDLSDKYMGFYLSLLPLSYISMIENEKNELVAFGITMPSLAGALKKTRGRLFPFGWYHIVKAMYGKGNVGIEMLLVGVRPDYRNNGLNALLIADVYEKMKKLGKKWAETNAILETNLASLQQWKDFDYEMCKKRRSYGRKIDEIEQK